MKLKTLFLSIIYTIFIVAPSCLLASFTAQDYMGRWKTEAKDEESKIAIVEMNTCSEGSESLCGKIVWLEEPIDPETGLPKKDKKNKSKDLRDRDIMGLQMVSNMEPKQDGGYGKGEIYSPKTGKTYTATMKLDSKDQLNVTGHVFIFSRTQNWTRVPDEEWKALNEKK